VKPPIRPIKRIPFTAEGYQKILEEKKKLLLERPDAVEHLRKAREMGDLSENGYYKAARARLSGIDARLRHLDNLTRFAKIVQTSNTGFIDIGNTVTVMSEDKTYVYTIVGGYESDPRKQTISYLSPLGKALMGKKVSDVVVVQTPSKLITYTIKEIR